MMRKLLVDNLLKPALKRVGTVGAVLLVAGGDWLCANVNACGLVTQGGADTVMTYVTAVALLLVDVTFEWVDRKAKR